MRHAFQLALAVVLLATACDQLLPNRTAPPAVAATPAAPAPDSAPTPRPRRRPAPPDTTGVSESEAFSQIRRGLRRLVAAEQAFYAENGTYTGDLERLGYRMEGQTGVRFLWLKREAWAASGTHPAIPGRDCVIYVGPTTAAPTTLKYVRNAREGVAACDEPPPTRRRAADPGPPEPPRAAADTSSALDAVNPMIQMRVDLRNLVLSQNAYHATQGLYSRRTEPLALQYFWHRGVKVDILSANTESWAGRATHSSRPGKSCVVWSGPVPVRPTTIAQRKSPAKPGVPVCDD